MIIEFFKKLFCYKSINIQIDDVVDMKRFENIMIHLDPGHASVTPGKRSSYLCSGVLPALELYEWKFNREIVDKVTSKLSDLGFKVNNVCPEDDIDVGLSKRANRANEMMVKFPEMTHLFVSVHANAHGDGSAWTSARGWSVYTTNGKTKSDKLADCMYEAAEELLPEYGMTLRCDMSDGDYDWESNFTVILKANMPAVLVENLFYTNVKDIEFMLSDVGKDVISDIHVNGLVKYCEKYILS